MLLQNWPEFGQLPNLTHLELCYMPCLCDFSSLEHLTALESLEIQLDAHERSSSSTFKDVSCPSPCLKIEHRALDSMIQGMIIRTRVLFPSCGEAMCFFVTVTERCKA